MKQGNKMSVLAKMIAKFGYEGADHQLGHAGLNIPTRGRNTGRRIRMREQGPRYKPASSSGFRGAPRTSVPCGSVPAPTIDQVRKIELKYGQRLQVRHGLMFFKEGGDMFTQHEAQKRKEAQQCPCP
jgi:hypothetical protein